MRLTFESISRLSKADKVKQVAFSNGDGTHDPFKFKAWIEQTPPNFLWTETLTSSCLGMESSTLALPWIPSLLVFRLKYGTHSPGLQHVNSPWRYWDSSGSITAWVIPENKSFSLYTYILNYFILVYYFIYFLVENPSTLPKLEATQMFFNRERINKWWYMHKVKSTQK